MENMPEKEPMENKPIYIGRDSDAFPRRLLHMADPPKGLYVIGTLPADDLPSVAIVGSRMCSPYGRRIACRFGMELAAQGVQIISGMALGIDGHAHEGALASGGRTFAVLGCGADICYPEKNRTLYQEIPKKGGILSEEPPGTLPLPYHFPKRNRIISGICMNVLSDMPEMQFYTANNLNDEPGKDGAVYGRRGAVCFETQFWPDAVNRGSFPGGALNTEEEFHSRTTYRFNIK